MRRITRKKESITKNTKVRVKVKAKRLWLKLMMPNIHKTNKCLSMTYQKMPETSLMLITITSKEMFFPQVITMIHKAKLIPRIMPCNQAMESTQLCSHKVKKDMIFQKMLETSQTLTMITNREMFFQVDISMTHKAKLISKIMLCNQEMENIQLCLMKRKIRRNTSISIIINIITKKFKMTKNLSKC
jgi:hypothetical protein